MTTCPVPCRPVPAEPAETLPARPLNLLSRVTQAQVCDEPYPHLIARDLLDAVARERPAVNGEVALGGPVAAELVGRREHEVVEGPRRRGQEHVAVAELLGRREVGQRRVAGEGRGVLLADEELRFGIWPAPLTEIMHASVGNLLEHVSVSKLPAETGLALMGTTP